MRKMKLAMRTEINYDSCNNYIRWAKETGFIEENWLDKEIALSWLGSFICSKTFNGLSDQVTNPIIE
jgi:ubiquinone biosynthesis protein COQ9